METKPQSDQNPDEVINDQDLNAVSAEVEAEITENETHEPVMEEQEKELTGSEITSEDELPSGEAPSAETPEITNTETPDTVVLAEAEVEAEVVAETEAEVNTEAETEERLPAPAETETPAETEAPAVTETLAETEAPAEVLQETSMEASPAPDPEVVPEVSEKEPVAVLPDESSDDDEQDDSEEEPEGEDAGQPGELEGMTREELVVRLEELVKQDDVNKIKGEVSQIKVAFLKLNKEFKHEAYQKLAAAAAEIEGDNESEESPVIPDDEIEERLRPHSRYTNRTKVNTTSNRKRLKFRILKRKIISLKSLKCLSVLKKHLKKPTMSLRFSRSAGRQSGWCQRQRSTHYGRITISW